MVFNLFSLNILLATAISGLISFLHFLEESAHAKEVAGVM
jgi:hypothetical protein